ncbi:MAG: hypothetical protein QOI66_3145 [Myxococcales bacterium]|jgi:hypothetical protein|nr:hypothetical protein [Myxococcales bacterium]
MSLLRRSLDELTIDDEPAVARLPVYALLKEVVRDSNLRFLVPEPGATSPVSWDRALFLNLTFWDGRDGADVLCEQRIPADVVAHVAWHQVASREIGRMAASAGAGGGASLGAAALFFAESIASAFDLYLLGRLVPTAPDSDFITSQIPIMAEAAEAAGLPAEGFAALVEDVVAQPERAFEEMRALLLDVVTALLPCRGATEALLVLQGFAGRRFEPLLHHFQLSNWILYARAYAASSPVSDGVVRQLDASLRQAPDALGWLVEHWLTKR